MVHIFQKFKGCIQLHIWCNRLPPLKTVKKLWQNANVIYYTYNVIDYIIIKNLKISLKLAWLG